MDAPAALKAASVPISSADCRTCVDPCDEGHEPYPGKFDVDMETEMLGSMKQYRRQVLISTNKCDWEHEVTEAPGTLATFLAEVQASASLPAVPKPAPTANKHGVFATADSVKLSILNGSHDTLCDNHELQTILVLPDYTYVVDVPRSLEGAQSLWNQSLDPAFGRGGRAVEGTTTLKTRVLPYSCVVLLCSHKKRDNKCHIAAPKLEHELIQTLNRAGWETHTKLEDLGSEPAIESLVGSQDEREAQVLAQLKGLSSSSEKTALILRCSHLGGHKYAGNLIIYTPQGSSVMYGRVTTHHVESIVRETIINGLILPTLFRGGLNVSRPGCNSLHQW